jgi:hypothetical protein
MEDGERLRKLRTYAAPHMGRPEHFRALVDEPLVARLVNAWRQLYVKKRNQHVWRRLFRSLEVAFHAGLFPSDGLTTVNDAGSRVGLWVSAFEVLFHPGRRGRVDKETVQRGLRQVPWDARGLTVPRYRVHVGRPRQARPPFVRNRYTSTCMTPGTPSCTATRCA